VRKSEERCGLQRFSAIYSYQLSIAYVMSIGGKNANEYLLSIGK